jgi:hypothetical protein
MQLGFVAPGAAQCPLYRARFTGETLRNLALTLRTAPAGADTVVATFQRSQDGGSTWTDITGAGTPSAQVAGAAIAGADLVNSFMLTAGDLVAVKLVSSNAAAAQPTVNLRDRREAAQGSPVPADATLGAYAIDGFIQALLCGTSLYAAIPGVSDGIRNVRKGRGYNW